LGRIDPQYDRCNAGKNSSQKGCIGIEMATKLKKIQIHEVSLVSRGANQHAMITLFKRDVPEIEVPKDSDRNFNASGRGPAHDRLWTAYDNRRRALGPGRDPHAFAQAWDALGDDEKQQIRNEEATVEAAKEAAAAAAEAERKKEMMKQMNDSKLEEIIKLAHDIDSGRISHNFADRAHWYRAITKAAEIQRKPNESAQQSFARYVTADADGRAMYRCYKTAAGTDYVAPAPTPVAKVNPAAEQIRKLAAELMGADPSMSRLDALVKIHAARPELSAAGKAA
jgi:hypothetical protein